MNRPDEGNTVTPSLEGEEDGPSEPEEEEPSSDEDPQRRPYVGRLGNPDRPSFRQSAGRGRGPRSGPIQRAERGRAPSDPSSTPSESSLSDSRDASPPRRTGRDEPPHRRREGEGSPNPSRNRDRQEMNRDYRERPTGRRAGTTPARNMRNPAPMRAGTEDPSILLTLHEEVMINRYRELVRQRVGHTNESFVEVRGVKVNTPKAYDGADDVSAFEEWLNAVLRTLRVINMCGPAKDAQRIDYCGMVLTGQASMWFQDEVESPYRQHPEWEFEDIICGIFRQFIHDCGIFRQFIHDVTAQTAETKYEAIEYDPAKGALAVYNDMKRLSRRMAEIPNEYSFKSSFLKKLPLDIVEPLRRFRRVSAETTPLEILLQHVKEVEMDNLALSTMRSLRKPTATPRPSAPVREAAAPIGRFRRRPQADATPAPRTPTNDRRDRKPDPNRGAPYRDARPPPDLTKVECYKCHKNGHYSNNCPDNIRMGAARVQEEGGEDADEHEDDPYGSQFETDLDEYEEFDEAPEDNRSGAEEEVVYMRAMNAAHDPEPIQRVYRSSLKKPVGTMTRPATSKTGRTCLALYVEVHGVRVYSLFDSGSTSDSVSPDFTQVAKVPTRTLEPPVPLQLGCVGSRSMINFGASARIRVGPIDTEEYFDVVNIDKYDAVIGTPFMVKHKIALDFEKMEIIFAGNVRMPALPEGEGEATAKPRHRPE